MQLTHLFPLERLFKESTVRAQCIGCIVIDLVHLDWCTADGLNAWKPGANNHRIEAFLVLSCQERNGAFLELLLHYNLILCIRTEEKVT